MWSSGEVDAVTGDATVVVDLGGAFAMPGMDALEVHFGELMRAYVQKNDSLAFRESAKKARRSRSVQSS